MPESSDSGFTYRAFISYSHADKAWADWLHKSLETYRVPSRLVGTTTAHGTIPHRLNPVFRDREELSSSPELGSKINEALAKSESLVVICSPASAASRWVNEEVLAYKRMGRGARIFCLIVAGEPNASEQRPNSFVRHSRESGTAQAGCRSEHRRGRWPEGRAADAASNPVPSTDTLDPQERWIPDIATRFRDDEQKGSPGAPPGRAAEECFCPALRFVTDADGRPTSERTEPIAADAREGKDGKPNAKLKLIAGMLGVGFDALKQREQRRQVQRMTAIASIALVVMAITIVLAIFALVSRHRAVIAQHEAVVAKQAAQRRQKQAEGLVGFMLGDLNTKLQQVNRLDIMQAVDDKAMAYFQSLPNTDVTPAALAGRAKALEKIATVRFNTGNLPGALAAYQASAKLSSRLAGEKPSDAARQIAYSRTLAWIGFVRWKQGNLDAAQHNFESAQRVLQDAQARAQRDPSLLAQLIYLRDDIGHVLEARGQPDAAEREYRKMLTLARQLVALRPDDSQFAREPGIAHDNLGKLALLRGDLTAAESEYRTDDAIETHLSERNPKDDDQRENMLRARAILGRTLAMAGDTQTGMRDLQQAVAMAAEHSKADPNNASSQKLLALYSLQLARLQRVTGNLAAARTLSKKAAALFAALTKKDPGNDEWRIDYAEALTEQAAELQTAGNSDAAQQSAQQALALLEPMLAKHPAERGTLLAAVKAKLWLAALTADHAAAQTLREQALHTIQAVKSDRGDPRLLAMEVEALLGLGEQGEARGVITRLQATGYRDPAFVTVMRRAHVEYQPVAITPRNRPPAIPNVAREGKARP